MLKKNRCIEKYLDQYANKNLWPALKTLDRASFVLIIPAFDEGQNFLNNLLTLKKNLKEPTQIIVILNSPIHGCKEKLENNLNLKRQLSALGSKNVLDEQNLLVLDGHFKLLISGNWLLEKNEGVGLARKMGADFALKLISEGLIEFPVIFSTDADAVLPDDYFSQTKILFKESAEKISAITFPFRHTIPKDNQQALAIAMYEAKLRQYYEGLKKAGSNYAFFTIGSAMAMAAESYAATRGYPKKAAGEDFYLLNKLAKVGKVVEVPTKPIKLSARLSSRVPFGTGPALIKLLEKNCDDLGFFYNEKVFLCLAHFLSAIKDNIKQNHETLFHGLDKTELKYCLKSLSGLKKTIQLRTNITDKLKAFDDYFDGFKTLKFIHYLRDNFYPNTANPPSGLFK